MRSPRRIVVLSLMGASAFALSACRDEQVQASVFTSTEACVAAGQDEATCRNEFRAAQSTHAQTAPRYDALAVCEEEHGKGQCSQAPHTASSSGSSFMPFFAGYMAGNLLSGSSGPASRVAPKPLYPVAKGGYASADGAARTSALSGTTTARASHFTRPASTIKAAPMSRASVAARGGFGSARTSFGG